MPTPFHKRDHIPGQVVAPDAQFNLQPDKLVRLLPDADRNMFAGCLRRSDQNILAVGKYLEGENGGTILYD